MPSLSTPVMVITNQGLAVASTAMPQGPYIHIAYFEIGSGYGYTPLPTDVGINGTLLYGGPPTMTNTQGVPTSYTFVGDNTLDIICTIQPDAGPWQFGEVALFLQDGTMFAKAVFQTPQTKFSSLGTNVASAYVLNCLLKLQQSVAVFQVDTQQGPPAILDIFQWSDVYPPSLASYGQTPSLLVKELDPVNDSTLLTNSTSSSWSVASTYQPVKNAAIVQNSSTTWVEFSSSIFHPNDLAAVNRQWLLETPDGFFRSVSSIVVSGSNYRLNLNVTNDGNYNNVPLLTAPPIHSTCRLYSYIQSDNIIHYDQVVDAPPTTVVSNGLTSPSPGVIQAYGLLQSPSLNTGRYLTSNDNLNYTAWTSGLYTVSGGSFGYPANMPVNVDGHIMMIAENPLAYTQGGNSVNITQVYYPAGLGGGNTNGDGLPIFWREWNASAGVWTNWFNFAVPGKQGTSFFSWVPNIQQINTAFSGTHVQSFNFTMPTNGWVWAFQTVNVDGNGQISSNISVSTNFGSQHLTDLGTYAVTDMAVMRATINTSVSVVGTTTPTVGTPGGTQITGYIVCPGF